MYTLVLMLGWGSTLVAAPIKQGQLHQGQEVLLKPESNHALSITRMGTASGNFNFTIFNNGALVHEDINQIDDIYLVFHDDVEVGDRIRLHVNSGVFHYKVVSLKTLPTAVKAALDPIVFARERRAIEEETRRYARQQEIQRHTIEQERRAREQKLTARRARQLQSINPVVASSRVAKKENVLVFTQTPKNGVVTAAKATQEPIPHSDPIGENF